MLRRLQRLVVDPEVNFFRTGPELARAQAQAEQAWYEARETRARDWHELARCHEVRCAALTAAAMFAAAQARRETRGWHRRLDFPLRDDARWDCWTLTRLERLDGELRLQVGTVDYRDPQAFQPRPTGGEPQ